MISTEKNTISNSNHNSSSEIARFQPTNTRGAWRERIDLYPTFVWCHGTEAVVIVRSLKPLHQSGVTAGVTAAKRQRGADSGVHDSATRVAGERRR